MRFLALDVGERTIGVATSDPLGMIASPRETLTRDGREVERLAALVAAEEVGEVVVGMPISLNGSLGPSAERAKALLVELQARLPIPVVSWDERLTTAQAEKMLIASDARRSKRRQVIDQVAAALILESYLSARAYQSGTAPEAYGEPDYE